MFSFSQLMPSGTIQNGTICMFNITSSKKLYRTFTFTVDTAVTLLLTQSKDGVQTTLTPNSNRNLLSSERKLSSVSNSYSVAGVDYVLMSYQTASDSTGFVSTIGPDQTLSPSKDFPGSSSSTTSRQESSSSGGSIVIIAVVSSVASLIVVGWVVIWTILWFWRRKIFKKAKELKEKQDIYRINSPTWIVNVDLDLNNFNDNVLPVVAKGGTSIRNGNKRYSSLKNPNKSILVWLYTYLDDEENKVQPTTEIKENISEKSGEESKYQSIRKSFAESAVNSIIYSDEESISVSILEPAELSSIEEATDLLLY